MDILQEKLSRFHAYLETEERLWEEFVREFKAAFTDTASEENAVEELEKLRMEKNQLEEYIAEFERLMLAANYEGEIRSKVAMFRKGLPEPLARACMNQTNWPKNIYEWKEAARNEHRRWMVKKSLNLAGTPKKEGRIQQWKTHLQKRLYEGKKGGPVPMEVDATQMNRLNPEEKRKLIDEGQCF